MSPLRCHRGYRALLTSLSLLLLATTNLRAVASYEDNKALAKHLKDLAKDHKKIMRVEKAAESLSRNEVWRVELGNGNDEERSRRPAMLVLAGAEGNDLAGSASVVAWIESLTKAYEGDEKIKKLLDSTTIYVWPRLNPD